MRFKIIAVCSAGVHDDSFETRPASLYACMRRAEFLARQDAFDFVQLVPVDNIDAVKLVAEVLAAVEAGSFAIFVGESEGSWLARARAIAQAHAFR